MEYYMATKTNKPQWHAGKGASHTLKVEQKKHIKILPKTQSLPGYTGVRWEANDGKRGRVGRLWCSQDSVSSSGQ